MKSFWELRFDKSYDDEDLKYTVSQFDGENSKVMYARRVRRKENKKGKTLCTLGKSIYAIWAL